MATNHPTSNHQVQPHKKRHLKLIGASQHDKSSKAAALPVAILCIHDPKRVTITLLDLEYEGVSHA